MIKKRMSFFLILDRAKGFDGGKCLVSGIFCEF